MANSKSLFERRRNRVRNKLKRNSTGRPRLSVFRSSSNIYAQIIDDNDGKTIVSASSLEKDMKGAQGSTSDGAAAVGKLVAERATKVGIVDVVFDRGGYIYHGRVKSLADAARENGLNF